MSRITFNKTWYGSTHIVIFNKLAIYLGKKGGWGIGFEIDPREQALTIDLVKFYIIFEKVWAD